MNEWKDIEIAEMDEELSGYSNDMKFFTAVWKLKTVLPPKWSEEVERQWSDRPGMDRPVIVDRRNRTIAATFSVNDSAPPDLEHWAHQIEKAVAKANKFCRDLLEAQQSRPDAALETIRKLNRERYGGRDE